MIWILAKVTLGSFVEVVMLSFFSGVHFLASECRGARIKVVIRGSDARAVHRPRYAFKLAQVGARTQCKTPFYNQHDRALAARAHKRARCCLNLGVSQVLSSVAVEGSDVGRPLRKGGRVEEVFGAPPLLPLSVTWECEAMDEAFFSLTPRGVSERERERERESERARESESESDSSQAPRRPR